jgi:sec-independent protein translocase protein TatA
MFGLGLQELLVILVITLVIFGPSKLPQIGSGLGKAIRDFKKGVSSDEPEEGEKEGKKTCHRALIACRPEQPSGAHVPVPSHSPIFCGQLQYSSVRNPPSARRSASAALIRHSI